MLLLGIAEAVLTFLEIPPEPPATPMPAHPELLWVLEPGEYQDDGVRYQINRLGMRGPEPAVPKPAGTRRFLTLGDSSVFGFGVEGDAVFSSVAARALGAGVEAVNGAVPGYSTWQSLAVMRLKGMALEPDLLVIANLWSDNNFDTFVDREMLELAGGGEGQAGATAARRWLSRSALFGTLEAVVRGLRGGQGFQTVGWMLEKKRDWGRRRVALMDYAANLEAMVHLAKSGGAEVIFVQLANDEDLTARPNQAFAWTPYRQVMQDTARRHGARLIDVPALFKASGMPREALFVDRMHPATQGHALIGRALASTLQEAGWPTGGRVMTAGEGGAIPVRQDRFADGIPLLHSGPSFVAAAVQGEALRGARGGAGRAPATGGRPGVSHGHRVGVVPGGSKVLSSIRGELRAKSPLTGLVQIDAVAVSDRVGPVVGTTRLRGAGAFELPVRGADRVALRVILDKRGDGPDTGDPMLEIEPVVIDLAAGPVSGVVLDLDAGTVRGPRVTR